VAELHSVAQTLAYFGVLMAMVDDAAAPQNFQCAEGYVAGPVAHHYPEPTV